MAHVSQRPTDFRFTPENRTSKRNCISCPRTRSPQPEIKCIFAQVQWPPANRHSCLVGGLGLLPTFHAIRMVLDLSAIRPKADIAERDAGSGVSLLKVTAPRFWPPQQEIKRISTTNQPRGKVFHASPRHSLARPLNRGTGNMWMRGELSVLQCVLAGRHEGPSSHGI